MDKEIDTYLRPTYYFNYQHESVRQLFDEFSGLNSEQEKIAGLYLKVRDSWRYNPYKISFHDEDYRASEIIQRTEGHCVDKAILFITGLRALGIPARLHLAKVANHIAVERLIEKLGSNELAPHGMVDVFHQNKWVKASPAFNRELCDRFDVAPLDFTGTSDAVFQEFNRQQQAFMEYKEDYGHFDDVPVEFMRQLIEKNYPEFYRKNVKEGGFTL